MTGQRPRGPIDWTAVRLRMECAEMATRDALEPGPREAKAIMDARAQVLAKVPAAAARARDATNMIAFGLGRERYGIETRYVREVAAFTSYTPVPGTPDFLVGVTNLRGTVLAVMDLRSFFNIPRQGVTDLAHMIVLGGSGVEFGFLADVLHGQMSIQAADILPPAEVSGVRSTFLKGVTRDAMMLLDGARLIADQRLTINHSNRLVSS